MATQSFWDTPEGKKLQESRNKVPRYLFRAYYAHSGGGWDFEKHHQGRQFRYLNSPDAIVPHAFFAGEPLKDFSDKTQFREMVDSHTSLYKPGQSYLTKFSSWSPSLCFALNFLGCFHGSHYGAHICIMDTHRLVQERENIDIYYMKDLVEAGLMKGRNILDIRGNEGFLREYLVHGVIEGQFFKTVAFEKLRGIRHLFGWGNTAADYKNQMYGWTWGYMAKHYIPALTVERVIQLREIARRFNDKNHPYALAVTAALVGANPLIHDENRRLSPEVIEAFQEGVSDLEVPHDHYVQIGIPTSHCPQVQQMLDLLNSLADNPRPRRNPRKRKMTGEIPKLIIWIREILDVTVYARRLGCKTPSL